MLRTAPPVTVDKASATARVAWLSRCDYSSNNFRILPERPGGPERHPQCIIPYCYGGSSFGSRIAQMCQRSNCMESKLQRGCISEGPPKFPSIRKIKSLLFQLIWRRYNHQRVFHFKNYNASLNPWFSLFSRFEQI